MEYTLRCHDCGHEQTFAFDSFESTEDEGFFDALNEEANENGWEQIDGEWYCQDCWTVCDRCGDIVPSRYTSTVDGDEQWCSTCVDDNAYQCHDCDRYTSSNNTYWAYGDRSICQSCYEEHYYYCERCDTTVHWNDWDSDHDCCCACASRISDGRSDYHTSHYGDITHFVHGKPELTYNIDCGHFSDCHNDKRKRLETIRTFGFELEVDEGSCGEPDLEGCINALNEWDTNGYIRAFEEDGSLSDSYGLEIITNPMDKDTFDKHFDVAKFCSIIKSNGYCSHDANNMTSLHMHFNRLAFFGRTTARQTENIEKLYTFFAKNWDSLKKASRRGNSTRWCAIPDELLPYYPEGSAYRESWLEMRKCASEHKFSDHHRAINNGNRDTVEIRIGRGTLNPVSFSAWIDFMWRVVTNMKRIPLNRADETALWLKGMKPSTLDYLRSRKAFTDVLGEPLVEVEDSE